MHDQGLVSIVVPTFNRLPRLQRCLGKIQVNVQHPHEIIVVDGGSTDGTREWLAHTKVRTILEERREGAVRAFNRGFRAATGHYVTWFNDDAWPLPGCIDVAVELIERPDLPDLGMVAFYHQWHSPRNVLDQVTFEGSTFSLCHVRGYPYANFGLLRRSLLEQLDYADEQFVFFGFDPDLALKIQIQQQLLVLGCRTALVAHDEHQDDRKISDRVQGEADNAALFNKWNLPGPGQYPDPVLGYQRLRAERRIP